MQSPRSPAGMRSDAAVLPRVLLASTLANAPMLVLLLIPQLMRSRAGSETLLVFGAMLYVVLLAAALLTTPRVTAWAVPKGESWSPRTAGATAGAIRRSRPRAFWQRAGEWGMLFAAGQVAGLLVTLLCPYVEDNPRFGAAGEPRWTIHYGCYALQAITIYVFSCLSFAWLGTRLRALTEGS